MGEKGLNQADIICKYGLAFFDRYLNSIKDAENVLNSDDDMLALYKNVF